MPHFRVTGEPKQQAALAKLLVLFLVRMKAFHSLGQCFRCCVTLEEQPMSLTMLKLALSCWLAACSSAFSLLSAISRSVTSSHSADSWRESRRRAFRAPVSEGRRCLPGQLLISPSQARLPTVGYVLYILQLRLRISPTRTVKVQASRQPYAPSLCSRRLLSVRGGVSTPLGDKDDQKLSRLPLSTSRLRSFT